MTTSQNEPTKWWASGPRFRPLAKLKAAEQAIADGTYLPVLFRTVARRTQSGTLRDGTITMARIPKLTQEEEGKRSEAVKNFSTILSNRLAQEFAGMREHIVQMHFARVLNEVLDGIEAGSVIEGWWAAPWECGVAITKDPRGGDRYTVKVPQLRADFILSFELMKIGRGATDASVWFGTDGKPLQTGRLELGSRDMA